MQFIKGFILVLITLLTLSGCEDDPIIEPQSGSTASGSYARLAFPDSNSYIPNNQTTSTNP